MRECFDFIAGTSTGALIAAAIAAGVSADRILNIYKNRAAEIFTPPKPISDMKRLLKGYMYDPANIQEVLVSELGAAANWILDDSPVRLLLTAKGIDSKPWYFVQNHRRNAQTTGKLRLVDCAVASACAPTYFKPWIIEVLGERITLVDGGVGVTGNPVYQACIEAFNYDDFTPSETRVVSLGTGYFQSAGPAPRGLLGWLQWTVNTLLDAPVDQQTEIVNRHFPGILQRFDWPLPQQIDMADTSSIDLLVQIGNQAALSMDWTSILGIGHAVEENATTQ